MKNLYDPATLDEIRSRMARLTPDSPRQWGTMTPAQMAAHCANTMEMAVGDSNPPRMFIGRFVGPLVKRLVVRDEQALKRNTPTAPNLLIRDERNFETERSRLARLVEQFANGGPTACTTHPHTFFGAMTSQEWSVLMYKHLDHHLRQFGV